MNDLNLVTEVAHLISGNTFDDDLIEKVEDMSDSIMTRARIHFKNGYQLSIIKGKYSYGGDAGLYEISPIDKNGSLSESLLDDDDKGDSVLGYCDKDKVMKYIQKIGNMK